MAKHESVHPLDLPGTPTERTLAEIFELGPDDTAAEHLRNGLRQIREKEREAEKQDANVRLY